MSGPTVLPGGSVLDTVLGEGADDINAVPLGHLPIVRVLISSLVTAGSPRQAGESAEHARTLAEAGEGLPPIAVHRATMRVIDGMHRVRAAKLRGCTEIEARLVDADEATSFVLAVSENVRHGLPLSLADRKTAAARIVGCYPQWSDRKVGSVTSLSDKTVAVIRRRLNHAEGVEPPLATLGRDGRVRPRNGEQRREAARELILADPHASLRQIAQQAGISPETVRHVRMQLTHSGELGLPAREPGRSNPRPEAAPRLATVPAGAGRANRAFESLRADPSFRSTETGRSLLRMLAAYQVISEHGDELIEHTPAHCLDRLAILADACANQWRALAESVEQRRRTSFENERIALISCADWRDPGVIRASPEARWGILRRPATRPQKPWPLITTSVTGEVWLGGTSPLDGR
jgi:ParB-like chromosome segregation protein Spo0J